MRDETGWKQHEIDKQTKAFNEKARRKLKNSKNAAASAIRVSIRYGDIWDEFDKLSPDEQTRNCTNPHFAEALKVRDTKKFFKERANYIKLLHRDRFENGFRFLKGWFGGTTSTNGYYVDEICERDLRTRTFPEDKIPMMLKLLSCIPSADNMLTGLYKNVVSKPVSKLIGLDDSQTTFNDQMCSILRVDIDATFNSIEHLKDVLGNRLRGALCNAAVYAHPSEDRPYEVKNPHLYWVIDGAVCFTRNGRRRIQRFFMAILNALTYSLIPEGADLGGLANPFRGKNPFSPLWHTEIIEEEAYVLSHTEKSSEMHWKLKALSDYLDLTVKREKVERRWVEDRLGKTIRDAAGNEVHSNKAFILLKALAWKWVCTNHPDINGSGSEADLLAYLESEALNYQITRKQASYLARYVGTYNWNNFDSSKLHQKSSKAGICATEITESMSLSEKRAVGGKFVAQERKNTNQQKIQNSYNELKTQGIQPTQKLVAEHSGLSICTVKRCWGKVSNASKIKSLSQGVGSNEKVASSLYQDTVIENRSESEDLIQSDTSDMIRTKVSNASKIKSLSQGVSASNANNLINSDKRTRNALFLPSFLRTAQDSPADIQKRLLREYVIEKEQRTGIKYHNDKIILFGEKSLL